MGCCSCNHDPSTEAILASLNLILVKTIHLEELMATAAEQIAALTTRVEAQGVLLVDVAADFEAFKTAMEAERENLTAAGQAALDAANVALDGVATSLTNLDIAIGDADGSDVPPPPPEPTP